MNALIHFIEYSPWAPVVPVLLIGALGINFVLIVIDECKGRI